MFQLEMCGMYGNSFGRSDSLLKPEMVSALEIVFIRSKLAKRKLPLAIGVMRLILMWPI